MIDENVKPNRIVKHTLIAWCHLLGSTFGKDKPSGTNRKIFISMERYISPFSFASAKLWNGVRMTSCVPAFLEYTVVYTTATNPQRKMATLNGFHHLIFPALCPKMLHTVTRNTMNHIILLNGWT
jgi:hypothetical protein